MKGEVGEMVIKCFADQKKKKNHQPQTNSFFVELQVLLNYFSSSIANITGEIARDGT